jgi:hypothetical protein
LGKEFIISPEDLFYIWSFILKNKNSIDL